LRRPPQSRRACRRTIAKLRGCDLVKLRVSDVAPGGLLRARATIIQQKRGNRSRSRSQSPREMLWPSGSRFAIVDTTTGCYQAGVARASTSALGSMPGLSANGCR
jgi:hypothetical protein